jgi:hypothetical protein
LRQPAWLLVIVIAVVLSAAPCSAGQNLVDFQGYTWGGTLTGPGAPGDTLHMVGILDAADPGLGVDFQHEEVTFSCTAILPAEPIDVGLGIIALAYEEGRLEMFRDPSQDHDYATDPPNPTSPSSFTNGEACLVANMSDNA